MEASGSSTKPKKTQTAIILNCAGPSVLEVYDQLEFATEEDRITPEVVFRKLSDYCNPRSNEVLESYRFWNVPMTSPFDSFITTLRTQADKCNFAEKERMIRDKIVFSAEKRLQEKLLRDNELTLAKAIGISQAFEQTHNQIEEMNAQIDKVKINDARKQRGEVAPGAERSLKKKLISDCHFCGRSHENRKEKCFAWGKVCSNCNGRNHFATKCKKKHVRVTRNNETDTSDEHDSSEEWLNAVTSRKSRMTALMLINDQKVRFQVDTGADVNILCKKYVKRHQAKKTTQTLTMWNKTRMTPEGEATIKVVNPKTQEERLVHFTIVGNDYGCLLSMKTSRELGLITVNEDKFIAKLVENRAECNDLGDLGTVKLTLDPNVKPTILPCRKIPHSMKHSVKAEIETLLSRGILVKVEEPTEWVNQMTVVTKRSGGLRICIDPQPLNKALCREHFKLPTFDDVLPQLENAKVFSKLDVKEAYWHVRLDEESSQLTTMITPFGYRVRWTRLPFGLKVASEIFQRKLNEALEGLDGCINVADDIVIAGRGSTKAEAELDHEKNLRNLVNKCEEKNIKLNHEKTSLKQTEIEFMGHKIGTDGIRPSPDKVKVILETPRPTDVSGVKRFCGMVQYLSRFLNRLSEIVAPIGELTKKNTEFVWSKECDDAFLKIKELITKAPVLSYYNPQKPLEVQTDSSKDALGATLLQDGRPIEFASRELTETEKRWAQIEKEMLSVIYGLEKFDQYTYGREVTVTNDHKPLAQILKKPLGQAPMRLQRLLMRAGRYSFNFQWVQGSSLSIADFLSRDCITATVDENDESAMAECHQISTNVPDVMMERVREHTKKDPTLQSLITVILDGWPSNKNELPRELTPYFDLRDTLSVDDDVILKGQRVFIPTTLRSEIKNKLHSAHLAYDSMMRRAREAVFWVGMAGEIKLLADSCETCQAVKPANQKETLMHHTPESSQPWEKVGCDLMEISGRHYLITVDYATNFIEADFITSLTSRAVITKLKAHFARYGVPKMVISDCGSQFTSQEFKSFAEKWCFSHKASSPGHHKSNGRAESAVKIIKHMMKKALKEGQDQYEALLELRNTPRQYALAPAEAVFQRKLRTLLPSLDTPVEKRGASRCTRKDAVTRAYNKRAKDLHPLETGQPIYYQNPEQSSWNRGRVTQRLGQRDYEIEGENGGQYRRNRVHLRPKATAFTRDAGDELDLPMVDANEQTIPDKTVPEPDQATHGNPGATSSPARPKRITKTPAWQKDFVMNRP